MLPFLVKAGLPLEKQVKDGLIGRVVVVRCNTVGKLVSKCLVIEHPRIHRGERTESRRKNGHKNILFSVVLFAVASPPSRQARQENWFVTDDL